MLGARISVLHLRSLFGEHYSRPSLCDHIQRILSWVGNLASVHRVYTDSLGISGKAHCTLVVAGPPIGPYWMLSPLEF